MSEQNVEIVRTLFAYWNTRDDRAFELLADDVEMVSTYDMPGLQGVYQGHAAVRTFWREWLSAWDDVTVSEFELQDRGDEVLSVWVQDMRGRESDVVMSQDQAAIFGLRDGLVTRVRFFADPEGARAEFGR